MMATYSPQTFLKNCPNDLLAVYFDRKNLFADLEIATGKPTDVIPMRDAWLNLPMAIRNKVDSEFQMVHDLAIENGIKELHKALSSEGHEFPDFERQRCRHHKSLWAFLYHQELFEAAHKFTMPHTTQKFWQQYRPPEGGLYSTDHRSLNMLKQELTEYFRIRQGRGDLCTVEHEHYDGKEYLFIYPSDYVEASHQYEESNLIRRLTQPAFEVVIIFHNEDKHVDFYYHGQAKESWDIFKLYCKAIFGVEYQEEEKPKQVFQLEPLKTQKPPQNIRYKPEYKVQEIAVCMQRFSPVSRPWNTITVEANVLENKEELYDQLAENNLQVGVLKQVGLAVWMENDPPHKFTRVVISPSACRLKHHGRDAAIRAFLKDNGILISD